mmetsp:Transcript_22632/g.35405  ORF Transcript_22632/g.35405 Transcript_22632/m.35405 type:complete len:169 (+) Transcript_22632:18-524(+)|eukprot:CAMPEP_0184290168 /NCGR_PEP_ID=MMETSP1049-20130417/2513_1 /TAXON_ID=77928 /ORGANISM="Proteomonas sulcata, Strain CCMP704" /LENGTH=168 /DNA_ID=CAMNT_0026597269 /DNA_START=17 /DNA_END=523 /DNA_ORIENTATION=-
MSRSLVLLLLALPLVASFNLPSLTGLNPASAVSGVSRVCYGPSMQLASPQIAKPKVDVGQQLGTTSPQAEGPKTATPKIQPKKKTQDDETPMYKVILLGDNDYEQSHVVTQITKIIPSVQKEEAIRIFVEAQMTGSSVIIVCTEEHAEHYVQQLKRQQIYAKMEEDKK